MRHAAGGSRRIRPYAFRRSGAARRGMRYALTVAVLLGAAVAAARLDPIENRELVGVATVHDGDTLSIGSERIRLRGIDAPELGQTCRTGDAHYGCGRQALVALQLLVADRDVRCSGWERDRYGRLLAVCNAGGVDLNREMVQGGWAVAFGAYRDAESAARKNRVGLWAGEFERPRDWRALRGDVVDGEHNARGLVMNWLRQRAGWL